MSKVAVIAHAGKTVGGGLEELRETLSRAGVPDLVGGSKKPLRAEARPRGTEGRG